MFCFEYYSTKNLDYSNNKKSEQFLKQNTFCNLLLEVFTILICTRDRLKWQYLGCRKLRELVKKILFLDPCHRHLTEKLKKVLRARKNERKKNMELMMSGFNSIFWHRTDFPGSFFKSEQFRTFFFSSLQQNGVKIISEGSYDLKKNTFQQELFPKHS
jgi:hypothetical protein